MERISQKQIISTPFRGHTISFFNECVAKYKPEFDLAAQVIITHTTMGVNLLIASIQCEAPLATCIDILSALAASPKAIATLAEHKAVVMNFETRGDETLNFASFFQRPVGDAQSFFQFSIYGSAAMVVIPAIEIMRGDMENSSWLVASLVQSVQKHREQVLKKSKSKIA